MEKLKNEVIFFKQKNIEQLIEVIGKRESISRILNTLIWIEVDDVKLIETDKGVSHDGVCLTSKKIIAQLVIHGKITYVGQERNGNINGMKFKILRSVDIVIPKAQSGKSIDKLFRENRVRVIPQVEGVYSRKIDANNIYTCMVVFVEAIICS